MRGEFYLVVCGVKNDELGKIGIWDWLVLYGLLNGMVVYKCFTLE